MSKKKIAWADVKVLLVDDSRTARFVMVDMLKKIGVLQIVEVENGTEALKCYDIASDYFDLIICDWNMPEMDGLSFLQKVREISHDERFLMVTGRKDVQSIKEAKQSKVSGYIIKPFSLDEFEEQLSATLTD